MIRPARLFVAALCLTAFSVAASAQPAKARKAAAKTPAAEADPLAEARRQTAISLVTQLADEARNFRDTTLQARVQARSAEVLWATDGERARALFRRAWEAAESADAENERLMEEERRAQVRERGYYSIRARPSLRAEVLRLASRLDRALGEEFLGLLDEARKKAEQTATGGDDSTTSVDRQTSNAARRNDLQDPPAAVTRRLRLAVQLLEDGDTERAIQFADPALGSVNVHAVDFLARLRPKDAKAADERFSALVARTAQDPASDANAVSLLASYLFTPALYITFEPGGGSNASRWGGELQPPTDVSGLRAAFFNVAASVLLRPTPPADQDQSSAGRAGTFMVITRLLPLFERHAPDKVAALKTKLAALTPDVPANLRQGPNNALTRGLVPEDPNRDRVQETLNRLDEAKTPEQRDAVYADAVQSALQQNDPRLREFIDKIEDLDTRKQMRAWADFEQARKHVAQKEAAEALKLARTGELTEVQRAWVLTEAARLLAKTEPGRAVEVLEEAARDARRVDQNSPDRARALTAIATQLYALDRPRAWEMLSEVVKASNQAEGFSGEDGRVEVTVRTKNMTLRSSSSVESFDLAGLFAALSREDLGRAVELARGFTGEGPRAAATLAVARAVLDKKK